MNVKNPLAAAARMGWGLLLGAALIAAAWPSTAACAQTLTTLYSFAGSDGMYPLDHDTLIFDSSGNLEGTTLYGGVNGAGTVFELTPSGTETPLYNFTGGSDGGTPFGGLIADASGNLYGTTASGGTYGDGTVFELTPSGTLIVLYSFTGNSDGGTPYSGLVADASGNLYGTTVYGGNFDNGVVFKLTKSTTTPWPETVLHAFTGDSDGGYPEAGLIFDASGNLYGTTAFGGSSDVGAVFKLSPSARPPWTETPLYSFAGETDGSFPLGSLIFDTSGNLYGTTMEGGSLGYGTVFKLTPSATPPWTETLLYSFSGNDGASPVAGLIADAAGNLYGTTQFGGSADDGTVFKLTASGSETTLHEFTGSDGEFLLGGLIADAAGNLYGTTEYGGANGQGTVFKLALPASFKGVPGQPNCIGQSVSFLAREYGGIAKAAATLGYASVDALQSAVAAYCGG